MARLERELRRAVPDVVRVQIDPEPANVQTFERLNV